MATNVLVLFVLLTCVLTVKATDPCKSYHQIDEPQRSQSYSPRVTDALLCDRVLNAGWYRFKDAEMPFDQCIQQYHCGTHVPLWLKGTAPTVQDGTVTRTACGQYKSGGDCCGYKTIVHVRNCGQYMVYHLLPAPGCSMAYCTGPKQVCGPGEYSPTGQLPCKPLYPVLTHPPHLTPPIIEEPDFKFLCEVPVPPPSKDSMMFIVTWMLDGKPFKWQAVTGNMRDAALYGNQLIGHTSQSLSCSVQAGFVRQNSTMGPSLKSNSYWIGIRYNTTRVMIDHTHTKETVELTSTIPVVCDTIGDHNCSVSFNISTDNEHVYTDRCSVVLKPWNWNPATHTASTTYTITTEPMYAKVDKVSSKPGGLCVSHGDPHIKTFDGKKRFTSFKIGQFLMVKQRQGGSFRVEARTWRCGKTLNAGCNCAVAAREGNDVIVFDMCNGKIGHTVPRMKIMNPAMFTNKTQIVKDPSGNKHMLKFPSGAMVTVSTYIGSLDVSINAPASFSSDTAGTCGYFDGNAANDLTRKNGAVDMWVRNPNDFVESWRIPRGQSLFEVAKPLPQKTVGHERKCRCGSGKGAVTDCTDAGPIETHAGNVLCPGCEPVHPYIPAHVDSFNLTTPGQSTSAPHVTTTPYIYFQSTMPSMITSTPIPQSTKDNASKTCESAFKRNPSLNACIMNVMHLEYRDILDLCAQDLALTGDRDMAISAVTTLMEGCGHQTLVNPASLHYGSVPKVCPRACSLNGNCVNGKCVCDIGYESSDCSVKSREAPKITAISGGRYCDMEAEDCFRPTVIGENMFGANMKCLTEEMGTYMGHQYILQQDTNSVDFHSTKYVTCNINHPPKGTETAMHNYVMSLSSNGGATVGNRFNYTVYSSKCMICRESQPCSIKPNTCLINEKCHMSGDKDIEDHTGYCDPAQSNTNWTPFQSTTTTVINTQTATSPPSSVKSFQYYTGKSSGCGCYYDSTKTDCACCVHFGCPCNADHHHRCYDCFNEKMCTV